MTFENQKNLTAHSFAIASSHVRVIVSLFSMMLLVSCLTGCGLIESEEATAGAEKKKKGGQRAALIKVQPIEQREVSPKVIVVGSIVPKRKSVVASGANGVVDTYHVEEGQFVQKGETLSVLRMLTTNLGIKEAKALQREREHKLEELQRGSRLEEIAEAEARMLAAKAVTDSASAKLIRARGLFKTNAVNQNELDDAEERAEAARQLYLAAEAAYQLIKAGPRKEIIEQAQARTEAQQEQVAYLEAEKEKRFTKSPFDGYIVKEHTYLGQWLSKGDPVATLALLDEVDAVVNVDQSHLEHIYPGEKAHVRIISGRRLERDGKIVYIVPRSDWESGSRGFPVKVRLKNDFVDVDGHQQPVLKEGMMAEVTFFGKAIQPILVPKDSLVRTSRGMIIYVFNPSNDDPSQGTVQQIFVQTGISDHNQIQILNSDVKPGMLVVTEGAERLRPFQPARLAPEKKEGGAKENRKPAFKSIKKNQETNPEVKSK